jgi:metal-responsive CopG/Arc/MetJ family transcriptional regulator
MVWNNCGMGDAQVVRLPAELVAQIDQAARDELRSRSNYVAWAVTKALREPVEPKAAS